MNNDPLLEVVVCSVSDAIEAERGGAHRLEVISHFEVGGLTPEPGLVREIRAAGSLPLRVMLRETADFDAGGAPGIDRLQRMAVELAASGAEGVVLGFLEEDAIDIDSTQAILDAVPEMKATFHHAFDEIEDPAEAIRQVGRLRQVDRVLTSGGRGALEHQIQNLVALEKAVPTTIRILAGGGLNQEKLRAIRAATRIREYHIGRWARTPATVDGPVNSTCVREILEQIRLAPYPVEIDQR